MSELIEFHKRFTYKDSELSDSEIERRIVALSDFLIAQQVFLKTVKFRIKHSLTSTSLKASWVYAQSTKK